MSSSSLMDLFSQLTDAFATLREINTVILSIVSEMKQAGIAQEAGYPRFNLFLSDLTRISPREAARLIRLAEAVAENITPTGHVTPARLPVVREALHDGAVDLEHVDAILRVVNKIPTSTPGDTADIVEKHLVEIAREAPASVVREHGQTLLARIDPDGDRPNEELAEPKNSLRYSRDTNGRVHLTANLEPETGEELVAMVDTLAKPEGPEDQRPLEQRQGDALCDLIHHAIDTPDLPTRGGEKPHLNVTMDYADLVEGVGTATLENGVELSASAVRRIACDCGVVPMVMSGVSVPLDVGRARRLVSTKQRVALNARDRGCAFPSCSRPARWSDAHHIVSWLDGGPTDLDNLVLLCRRHHRIIHHSDWVVRMTGTGIPEFVPPRWLDPQQVPQRNLLHLRE
jgi:hypothetical protein